MPPNTQSYTKPQIDQRLPSCLASAVPYFADTGNAGYFIIKLALLLLAVLLLIEGLFEVFRPIRRASSQ